jgi:hypothetical protein
VKKAKRVGAPVKRGNARLIGKNPEVQRWADIVR